jgi:hypothetical protein
MRILIHITILQYFTARMMINHLYIWLNAIYIDTGKEMDFYLAGHERNHHNTLNKVSIYD